jgi:hypothetical protein
VAAALFVPSARRLANRWPESRPVEARTVLWAASSGSAAVLLFHIANHFATHRYLADFLPTAVLSALATSAIWISMAGRVWRRVLTAVLATAVCYSAVANLALGIGGPYFDMLKNRPRNYVRLAGWFSPFPETRPLINPRIVVRIEAVFLADWPGYREPLVTIGHSHYKYFLYGERENGVMRLVSRADESSVSHDMPDPRDRPLHIGMTYSPETKTVSVTLDGTEVLTHSVPLLITAPAQVTIGENLSDFGFTARRFPGRVRTLERTVSRHAAPPEASNARHNSTFADPGAGKAVRP